METKFLELQDRGIKIAYYEKGSGTPLFLLHPNSYDKEYLLEYLQEYAENGYQVFALDSRSHGDTVSHDETITISQVADDVIAFSEKISLKDIKVLGFSDGGNVALHLAFKRPDLFTKLISVSPNYTEDGVKLYLRVFIRATYKLMKLLNSIGVNLKKHILQFGLMIEDIGLTEDELSKITTKLIIIYAQNDFIKEDHLQKLHNVVPGSELYKIPLTNHLNIMKKPQTKKLIREKLLTNP